MVRRLSSSILELKKVCKSFEGVRVLSDVDLQVKEGEVLVILGPNGAGKTTLLKIIAGLLRPEKGELVYRGKKVEGVDLQSYKRRVTMVFQHPVRFNTTVYKNVAYGLKVRGFSDHEIKKRVLEMLEVVGLEKLRERNARTLSGGELQKLALARALVIEPEILLLDEPTANLDPKSAEMIEALVKQIQKKATLVISTHNLFQAKRLADRIVVLLDGQVVEDNVPKAVFEEPKDPRTDAFIRGEMIY